MNSIEKLGHVENNAFYGPCDPVEELQMIDRMSAEDLREYIRRKDNYIHWLERCSDLEGILVSQYEDVIETYHKLFSAKIKNEKYRNDIFNFNNRMLEKYDRPGRDL